MTRMTGMVALLLAAVGSLAAQSTPKIFSACYVSGTGTIYLINEPGLKTQCQNSNHVPFSWIDGLPGYDHGLLNGRADDDHPQYLLADGSRPLAGNLLLGGFRITGLAAGTGAGEAVRFEQAVKGGDAAGGDLAGTYPSPSVARLQAHPVASTAPTSGQVLSFDGATWVPFTPPAGVTVHAQLSGLDADDHHQYLLADGVRASTNGFAVTGTFGSGAIPASGPGTRLMWYPGKAAFRAGIVDGTQWDDANIGRYSVALGFNTSASDFGIAIGSGASARLGNSTALGDRTVASGDGATAMGVLTVAALPGATAMGSSTSATGGEATAMGANTEASGGNSTAMGLFASTNLRRGSFVYGDASTVIGGPGNPLEVVRATADNSFVVRARHVWFGTSGNQPTSAASYFTVDGLIASTIGGFQFPDGTVQTTANAGGVTDHGALTGLTDDDHPQYLLADGVRSTTNGFAVTACTVCGVGLIPVSGPGQRLMWYRGKGAFRAGAVSGAQWDDPNIGLNSVAMGQSTTASGNFSTAMGLLTTASGPLSTAMGGALGGSGTTASGFASTAVGHTTTASGDGSTAMGDFATASGNASTAMGGGTTASGFSSTAMGNSTTASGDRSTAMGSNTFASGDFSTAMGKLAISRFEGSFVYGDASTVGVGVVDAAANQFVVRAAGGTIFYSNSGLTAGVSLAAGAGAWASVSDVNRKENFRDLDGEVALERLAGMPVREWNYKAQRPSIRHLGPTAQDFYAAFGLGESDTTITTIDADGVALLAIQALERRTAELRVKSARVAELEARVAELERRLAALEGKRR